MDHEARIEKYLVEIKRLDELDKHLDVLWTQVHRYAYLAVLAPVVWYFSGFGWAFVELLVTGALVGTQSYLIKMRKSENRWNRASLVEDVQRIRAEVATERSGAQTQTAAR